jgi:hypothetical protein
MKYVGAVWGGIAISFITYFIIVKGAKGSSFISADKQDWIQNNTALILLISFVGWTILMQLLYWLFKINILKVIVLVGTFALAMAFAGNDLVNFIGVPLAGYESFKVFSAAHGASANSFAMSALQEQVKTPTLFLLVAGMIMVITLWISKKAKSVVKTTINLADQNSIDERFESSILARVVVRQSIQLGHVINRIIPTQVSKFLDKRFDPTFYKKSVKKDKTISFDLIRASVNLVVASVLIAFATSLKLPLSTTYVTFMVAMGTSLADGAWNRESAVYRITGVITVIGGWFFTALSAFTVAFLVALVINWGGIYAIFALIMLAAFFVYKTHGLHKKRTKNEENLENNNITSDTLVNGESVYASCNANILTTILALSEIYKQTINGLIDEKHKKLKKALKETKDLNKNVKTLKKNIQPTISRLEEEESVESGHYYVQIMDYLRETAHCMTFITQPVFEHVDNNHAPLKSFQSDDLRQFMEKMEMLFKQITEMLTKGSYKSMENITNKVFSMIDDITKMKKKQIKSIKKDSISTRTSLLYLDVLTESKNLLLYINNLLKASRDFSEHNRKNGLKKILSN